MKSWRISIVRDKLTETYFAGLTSFSVLVGSPCSIFFHAFAPAAGIRSRNVQITIIRRMRRKNGVSESRRIFAQPPSTVLSAAVVCDFVSSRALQLIVALPAKANTRRSRQMASRLSCSSCLLPISAQNPQKVLKNGRGACRLKSALRCLFSRWKRTRLSTKCVKHTIKQSNSTILTGLPISVRNCGRWLT